jgi:hypothetical protein
MGFRVLRGLGSVLGRGYGRGRILRRGRSSFERIVEVNCTIGRARKDLIIVRIVFVRKVDARTY